MAVDCTVAEVAVSMPQVIEAASIWDTQNRPFEAIATPWGRPVMDSVEAIVPAGWVAEALGPVESPQPRMKRNGWALAIGRRERICEMGTEGWLGYVTTGDEAQ